MYKIGLKCVCAYVVLAVCYYHHLAFLLLLKQLTLGKMEAGRRFPTPSPPHLSIPQVGFMGQEAWGSERCSDLPKFYMGKPKFTPHLSDPVTNVNSE